MKTTLALTMFCFALNLLAQTTQPAQPVPPVPGQTPEKPVQAAPTGLAKMPTQKPIIHGRHWMAITGKPLAATAGAMTFQKGGNAIDAACAMLAATCTMWDVLSWGGETQALIYHPKTQKVIALNALGIAPTGATAEFFKKKNMKYPPGDGPLSAVTPGTPGGLMTMLAEYGTMSLKEILAPAMQLAEGYPIEKETAERISLQMALFQAGIHDSSWSRH
jgi:gamma-glutamyltranspeptidase/glutathione hydrolase